MGLSIIPSTISIAESLPASDQRAQPPRTLNTPRDFPSVESSAEWQSRAKEIREHILVSCGLWPLPEKSPLNARVFGRINRDDYSVEKVYFETYPGFYLAGNLYRPAGQGNGPFPGILNPHGHWANGRMADTPDGSIAARCISFARQGMIAFSYDMAGYNDTKQVTHNFASDPTNQLWSISLMGLQTWNSIRALDFLESLPDIDKKRLACTGESGGGTQTFMLGAVDDRLAVQAPIVMVSHTMQGGCLCENAPGLRVDYSNMEFAAVPAPRSQILVAAAGDWTKDTLTVEGPAIAGIYRLFNASEKIRYVRFDFGHNYNKTSRESVYEWFGQWLLKHPNPSSLKEKPYVKEPDSELLVWPDGKLPEGALNESSLIQHLIENYSTKLRQLRPTNQRSLNSFKEFMRPLWRHTLQIDLPERGVLAEVGDHRTQGAWTIARVALGRSGRGDRVPAIMMSPIRDSHRLLAILTHPNGKSAYLNASNEPIGLAKQILDRGHSVLLVDTFLTGELANAAVEKSRKPFANYFTTYNRTDLQERVQDLISAATFAQSNSKGRQVVLCGAGGAGLWALLASPVVDAVVADCDGLDSRSDAALLALDLFVPGLRRLGGFEGAACLAAPHPLLLHNTGDKFSTQSLRETYDAIRAGAALQNRRDRLSDEELARWVDQLTSRN